MHSRWRGCCGPAGGSSTTASRALRHGDPEAGPFSERYVFPDAAPLHLSRIQLALERAGVVTDHVEGLQGDYATTLTHWLRRLEDRLDDAVRLAGPERVRVWRLYLRTARKGFETGFLSVYQVRGRRPAGPQNSRSADPVSVTVGAPAPAALPTASRTVS